LFDFDLGKKKYIDGKKRKERSSDPNNNYKKGLSPAEATWEDQVMVQPQFPEFFLGDKEVVRGEE
jgi:hypothetical protein